MTFFLRQVGTGVGRFHRINGTTFASSSAFYGILCAVPLILFFVASLGHFLGSFSQAEEEIFKIIKALFPHVDQQILGNIKQVLRHKKQINAFDSVPSVFLFCWSSLGLFGSFLQGVQVITRERVRVVRYKKVKSLSILSLSFLSVVGVLTLTPFLMVLIESYQFQFNPQKAKQLLSALPQGDFSRFLEKLLSTKRSFRGMVTPVLIYHTLGFCYFSLLFKILLGKLTTWSCALFSSGIFVGSFYLGKKIFGLYFSYVLPQGAPELQGLYFFIFTIIWIYFMMSSFFLSLCTGLVDDGA